MKIWRRGGGWRGAWYLAVWPDAQAGMGPVAYAFGSFPSKGRAKKSHDGDYFNLNQPIRPHQLFDADQCARGRMLGRKVAATHFADDRYMVRLQADDVQVRFYDVAKRRPGGGKRMLEILERLD